ncbi:MAG: hypothetical protein H0X58_03605, partial [Acidimicrobiia bacterium]|nr:hypothetical protein [Acidimicrobiia bacterium]
MVDKKDEEDPAPASDDQDAPDWTTWLRSRLERVSSSERKAAGSVHEVPGESVGGDEQGRTGTGPEGETATPAPTPAPTPGPTPAPRVPALTFGSTTVPLSEIEALRAAVTALVAGVGTLADTFSGFRSSVTDRLEEYSETVQRVTSDTATELGEYRKAQAGSTDDLGRAVAEVRERLRGLSRDME